MSTTSILFRMARASADARALSSGSAAKVARRAKNKVIGRSVARLIWRAYR